MARRRPIWPLAWLLLLAVLAAAVWLFQGRELADDRPANGDLDVATPAADDDQAGADAAPAKRVEVVDGVPVLLLDETDLARAGLVLQELQAVSYVPEIRTTGLVVDVAPALALVMRWRQAGLAVEMAEAAVAAARAEHERLDALYRQDSGVAAKQVTQAQTQLRLDAIALRQATAARDAVQDESQRSWGEALTTALFEASPDWIEELGQRRLMLVQVAVPRDGGLDLEATAAMLGIGGARATARALRYLGPAPQADPLVVGETHFFLSADQRLRAGMRADVWLAGSGEARTGVVVPDTAVVWAMGRAWAYGEIGAGRFVRLAVPTDAELAEGWFVAGVLRPGERIVTAGAQTLYAEEFRWQIQEEDDD